MEPNCVKVFKWSTLAMTVIQYTVLTFLCRKILNTKADKITEMEIEEERRVRESLFKIQKVWHTYRMH